MANKENSSTWELDMKEKEIKLDLPWIETLDLICEPAPLAPELSLQLKQKERESQKAEPSNMYNTQKKNNFEEDLVYDDFLRETLFYRLAQAAVLEGIPKLHKLGVPTKRPEDYFAEMAKTDEHMQKVRKKLKTKENVALARQKAREMRKLKKFGKKVQVEKFLERQEEKRQIIEKLKKYKKGKTTSLDFLDDEKPEKTDSNGIMKSKKELKRDLKKIEERRMRKDRRYGSRGNKRGWKKNTAKDLDNTRWYGRMASQNSNSSKKGNKQKRPGKEARQNARVVKHRRK